MPRTQQQLEQAAADAEAWLDSLDPSSAPTEDTTDLRAIAAAMAEAADADSHLRGAVRAARDNGRSWARVGLVLGVSKQAASQRFGAEVESPT